MFILRRVAVATVSTAGLLAVGVSMPTSAAAATTGTAAVDCEVSPNGSTGLLRCYSGPDGTSQFRAIVQCENGSYQYGNWNPFGNLTSASCPAGTGIVTRILAEFR
ncbi:hypothetical protein [Kribbella sp. NPDC051770]|uniref:hypothetical protein n=1 Tax=Kribbella sp. NPDC051770 TaxID=3155413 RepID=UPI00343008A9